MSPIELYIQVQAMNEDKDLIELDGVYSLGILETEDVADDVVEVRNAADCRG